MDPMYWVWFHVALVFLLALDLFVFHRKDHKEMFGEALGWSAFWIGLGLAFGGYIYFVQGHQPGTEYLTAFLIEKALSLDNLFVFLIIFRFMGIADRLHHKVLFYGIVLAVVLRGAFIFAGIQLMHRFDWLIYVLGALLIIAGARLLREGEETPNLEEGWMYKTISRILPISKEPDNPNFWFRRESKLLFTPLMIALLMVSFSDVVFALDSIPAVLAVTDDLFIAYTSNIAAILGLRALYFVLENVMDKFHLLGRSLALVLIYIGVKMCIAHWYHIPTLVSLGVVVTMITLGIVLSLVTRPPAGKHGH